MRNISLIFLLSWVVSDTLGQTQLLGSPTTLVKNRGAFMSDSLLYIPKRTKLPSDTGAIRYAIADSSVYVWTGSQWRSVSISSGVYVPYTGATADVDLDGFSLNAKTLNVEGTAGTGHLGLKHQSGVPSISANLSALYANSTGDLAWQNDNLYASTFKTSNQTASRTYTFQNKSYTVGDSADIALKVNISDTGTMLAPYLRKVDTSAMLTSYLRKVDTASMLTPYLRKVDTSAMLSSYLRKVDTASMLTPYLRKIDTLTMLSPYVRAAGYGLTKSGQSLLVDTAAMATRARVQKAVDSLGGLVSAGVTGTGTTNYIPKFTSSTAIGNSQMSDNGTNVGIGTTGSTWSLGKALQFASGVNILSYLDQSYYMTNAYYNNAFKYVANGTAAMYQQTNTANHTWSTAASGTADATFSWTERMRLTSDGELLIATTSDAGAYALQVTGSIYNTTGAALAVSSGNVGIGTASPSWKLTVAGADMMVTNGTANISVTATSNLSRIRSNNIIAFDYGASLFEAMRINTDGELLIGSTSDAGAYALQVTGAIYNTTTLTTGAPTSGTAKPWRLGEAATVSPTSPNRTIRVEIDGTVYYIHAKTTND